MNVSYLTKLPGSGRPFTDVNYLNPFNSPVIAPSPLYREDDRGSKSEAPGGHEAGRVRARMQTPPPPTEIVTSLRTPDILYLGVTLYSPSYL